MFPVVVFFLCMLWKMKLFVEDFFATMQTAVVIFDMKDNDHLMYPGIESHHFRAVSPVFIPFFSLPILNDAIFVTDFTAAFQSTMFIFSKQMDINLLSHGIANKSYLVYASCIYLVYFLIIIQIKKCSH